MPPLLMAIIPKLFGVDPKYFDYFVRFSIMLVIPILAILRMRYLDYSPMDILKSWTSIRLRKDRLFKRKDSNTGQG